MPARTAATAWPSTGSATSSSGSEPAGLGAVASAALELLHRPGVAVRVVEEAEPRAGRARRGHLRNCQALTVLWHGESLTGRESTEPRQPTDGPMPSDCGVLASGEGWC